MEVKTELKIPSSGIHDIRYFYNIVEGLRRRDGIAESVDKTFEHFATMINNYNEAKASKYGLSFRPREVQIETVKRAVSELVGLNLIIKKNGYYSLTEAGKNVAMLIEMKDSNELKKVFTKLMLENYNIFEYFLKRIKEVSNGNGLLLPSITSSIIEKYEGNTKKVAQNYVDILNKNCQGLTVDSERLFTLLEKEKIDLMEKKTEKTQKLQAVIEKFVVSEIFESSIESRRAYDYIRSRTTFLDLTNYGVFEIEGFPVDITYSISDFEPSFIHNMERIDYSKGSLYINCPSFEEMRTSLKALLLKIYVDRKNEFGYVKISEMRDMVCKELKISDNLFDTYFMRLYKEEPKWLSLTYLGAGERITEKHLPIVLEEPMRELFTSMKISLGR